MVKICQVIFVPAWWSCGQCDFKKEVEMPRMAHPVASGGKKGGMRSANDHQESCKPSAKSIEMTAKSYGSAKTSHAAHVVAKIEMTPKTATRLSHMIILNSRTAGCRDIFTSRSETRQVHVSTSSPDPGEGQSQGRCIIDDDRF